jgi:hypothetical protein
MKAPLHVPALAVAALLAPVVALRAVELPASSPFLPASVVPAATAPALDSGGIELHGVIPTPVGPLFSIYNTARKSSTMVGLNETGTWGSGSGGSFVVRSYRQVGEQDQVTVEYQGRSSTLVTKKSKVGVVTRPGSSLAANANGAAPALSQTVSLNPTPETEAQRLQAVADEVARRRDLRAQGDAAAAAPTATAAASGRGAAP